MLCTIRRLACLTALLGLPLAALGFAQAPAAWGSAPQHLSSQRRPLALPAQGSPT